MSGNLSDLSADELAMLGHALRSVPGNACLTGNSAARLAAGDGFAFFHDIEAYKSLWEKVAVAIKERDDMAEFKVPSS